MLAVWDICVALVAVCLVERSILTTADMVCYFSQAPDPESNDALGWTIPILEPCHCTEVRIGGVNTTAPQLPFRVKFYDTLLQSRRGDEIRAWLNCPCHDALGMQSGAIPDASLSASNPGSHDGYTVEKSRLYYTAAWCSDAQKSEINDQWIRVDLEAPTMVTGLITQGRHLSDVWVTSYTVQYSNDEITWSDVTGTDGLPMTLPGNVDDESLVTNFFPAVLSTRFIQIQPLTWTSYICLRFEILGCRACLEPLGIGNGSLPDISISTSDGGQDSVSRHSYWEGVVWCLYNTGDRDPWIRVDLGAVTTVTGLVTYVDFSQDLFNEAFKVQYSDNVATWSYVSDNSGSAVKFQNNVDNMYSDMDPTYTYYFPGLVSARFIQIRGVDWDDICLNFDLLGCSRPYLKG